VLFYFTSSNISFTASASIFPPKTSKIYYIYGPTTEVKILNKIKSINSCRKFTNSFKPQSLTLTSDALFNWKSQRKNYWKPLKFPIISGLTRLSSSFSQSRRWSLKILSKILFKNFLGFEGGLEILWERYASNIMHSCSLPIELSYFEVECTEKFSMKYHEAVLWENFT
jgi:hypothetical protein